MADLAATKPALLQFFVPGTAKPAGSKRGFIVKKAHEPKGRVVLVDTSDLAGKHWRVQVQLSARAAGAQLLDGPLVVRMDFVRLRPKTHWTAKGTLRPGADAWPASRPDVLKLARGVEDALTGLCWRDDAQIVLEPLSKRYQQTRDEPVGVHIWINSL